MPYINLNSVSSETGHMTEAVHDGVHFAHSAVRFASLGLCAKEQGWQLQEYHLFALAIELAFKSLALRSGASLTECKAVSHRPSAMIALIERHGTSLSECLKTRLSNDDWFKGFLLLSRYPAISQRNKSLDTTIFLHPDYPEMIAAILETTCIWPLEFERGNALAEIRSPPGPNTKIAMFTEVTRKNSGRKKPSNSAERPRGKAGITNRQSIIRMAEEIKAT
jgi:hypothetical protein